MVEHIDVHRLREWFEQKSERLVVLDVREAHELAICSLPGSLHIPMAQIPGRLDELDKDAEIVVMCHHGMRSLQVANYLTRAGYLKVYNLTGGIHAWANVIEPTMAKY